MKPNVRVLTEHMPQYFAEKKAQQAALVKIAERKNQEDMDAEMVVSLVVLGLLITVILVMAFSPVRL